MNYQGNRRLDTVQNKDESIRLNFAFALSATVCTKNLPELNKRKRTLEPMDSSFHEAYDVEPRTEQRAYNGIHSASGLK